MKIGIYGGTFNPPHIGHLLLAERSIELLKLDKIIFVPSFIPPHKREEGVISAKHRLKMLKLCIKGKKYFEVSEIEIQRGGTSYTCDTIGYFTRNLPDSKLFLLVGYDNFVNFHLWKNYKKIFDLCTVIVLKRGSNISPKKNEPEYKNDNIKFIDTPLIDISSSEIRKRVEKGKSIDYYTTRSVVDYIKSNNLYKY